MSEVKTGKMTKMKIGDITHIIVDDLVKTESSNINQVAYQECTKKAFVLFKNGGLYEYDGVEKEDYESLRDAESVGRHLRNVFTKNDYEYKKLENSQLNAGFDPSVSFNPEEGKKDAKDS